MMDAIVLILSDARGIYIPRDFLTDQYNETAWEHCNAWGLTKENLACWQEALKPDDDYYWEAWNWVLENAKYTDKDGSVYHLYQDGDLWGLCYDKMTNEEKENFGMEVERE
jgi:hypothetical protein